VKVISGNDDVCAVECLDDLIEVEVPLLISFCTTVSYVGDRAAARPTRIVVGREVGVHQIAGHVGTVLRCALGVVDGKLNLVAESLQLLVGHRAGVDVVGHIHHVVTQWLTC
jgi:hypothetical protein